MSDKLDRDIETWVESLDWPSKSDLMKRYRRYKREHVLRFERGCGDPPMTWHEWLRVRYDAIASHGNTLDS